MDLALNNKVLTDRRTRAMMTLFSGRFSNVVTWLQQCAQSRW